MIFHITAIQMTLSSTLHAGLMFWLQPFASQYIWQTCLAEWRTITFNSNLTRQIVLVSVNSALDHNFSIELGTQTISPSRSNKNLVVLPHCKTTQSGRFFKFNIRKFKPFLSEQATQFLVIMHELVLDYCVSMSKRQMLQPNLPILHLVKKKYILFII